MLPISRRMTKSTVRPSGSVTVLMSAGRLPSAGMGRNAPALLR